MDFGLRCCSSDRVDFLHAAFAREMSHGDIVRFGWQRGTTLDLKEDAEARCRWREAGQNSVVEPPSLSEASPAHGEPHSRAENDLKFFERHWRVAVGNRLLDPKSAFGQRGRISDGVEDEICSDGTGVEPVDRQVSLMESAKVGFRREGGEGGDGSSWSCLCP